MRRFLPPALVKVSFLEYLQLILVIYPHRSANLISINNEEYNHPMELSRVKSQLR